MLKLIKKSIFGKMLFLSLAFSTRFLEIVLNLLALLLIVVCLPVLFNQDYSLMAKVSRQVQVQHILLLADNFASKIHHSSLFQSQEVWAQQLSTISTDSTDNMNDQNISKQFLPADNKEIAANGDTSKIDSDSQQGLKSEKKNSLYKDDNFISKEVSDAIGNEIPDLAAYVAVTVLDAGAGLEKVNQVMTSLKEQGFKKLEKGVYREDIDHQLEVRFVQHDTDIAYAAGTLLDQQYSDIEMAPLEHIGGEVVIILAE